MTILRFQPIINKNNLVSKRLDTHEFFWFGTNNSHVVWHKYKKLLIDSIAKLRLFNCIILFGDHHKSSNNNSFKIWQIFGRLQTPMQSVFHYFSGKKKEKMWFCFKKAGQQHWSHPHCRGVAPTEIWEPSEQKSRCYLAWNLGTALKSLRAAVAVCRAKSSSVFEASSLFWVLALPWLLLLAGCRLFSGDVRCLRGAAQSPF